MVDVVGKSLELMTKYLLLLLLEGVTSPGAPLERRMAMGLITDLSERYFRVGSPSPHTPSAIWKWLWLL